MTIKPYKLSQILKGTLSPYKAPLLKIKIHGCDEKFDAIIDTGAYQNHVTGYFTKQTNSTPFELKNEISANAGLEEGNKVFKHRFSIDGVNHVFEEEFTEMKGVYPHPIILGAKFLNQCKEIHIYSRDDTFELHF